MPELPEVETIKRQLTQKIVGKALKGQKVTAVRRRGKMLMIDLADGYSLVFHLMLNGQIILNGEPSPYTRKVFTFDDGTTLVLNDSRKFAWWKKVKSTKALEDKFGPEALDFDYKLLRELFAKRSRSRIKPLLMDQGAIAGIGNIYADEILYAAKIHPLRLAGSLSEAEVKRVAQHIKKVLEKAIATKGSSVKYYVDALGEAGSYAHHHKVYQKVGTKCKRCQTPIQRIEVAGRGTYFCATCQSL